MENREQKNHKLREKMQNFIQEPPAGVWESIKENIESEKKTFIIPVFWKYAAAILILVAVSATLYISNISDKLFDDTLITTTPGTPESESSGNRPSQKESNAPAHTDSIEDETKSGEEIPVKAKQEKPLKVQKDTSDTDYHKDGSKADFMNHQFEITNRSKIAEKTTEETTADDTKDTPGDIQESPLIASSATIDRLPMQIEPSAGTEMEPGNTSPENTYSWDDVLISEVPEIAEIEDETEKMRFSLSAMMSPLYTYRDLGNISSTLNQQFNESEAGKISYAGGLNIGLQANNRLSIHSGLIFSRMGISVNDILAVADLKQEYREDAILHTDAASAYLVSNSVGSIVQREKGGPRYEYSSVNSGSTSWESNTNLNYLDSGGLYNPANNYVEDGGRIDQYFQYLEVPFLLKYKLIDRSLDFNILGGLSTNFLIGNNVLYTTGDETSYLGETTDIQSINYSGNIGFGLDYNLNSNFSFLFEPQFKYYLNSINSSSLIGNRPYSFGLYTGVVYLF